MAHYLISRLTNCKLPLLLATAALLLTLPALATGWQFDDYVQRDLLRAHPGVAGLLPAMMDLFTFLDGDPVHIQRQINHGLMAWWTLPTAHTSFWRPFSGLTHWLDYQLWPQHPMLMHLHNLAWYAALVIAVTLLYRRFMGQTVGAGLAATLYAIDEAHGFAVAWIANRNALCATLFGVLALLAHRRWRTTGRRRDLCWSLLWLGCGLLSAEAAIATLAYLAAYALWLEGGNWRQRLLSLLPSLIVVTIWRSIYRTLGYGAWGTAYLDPPSEPLRYIEAVIQRGPLLLLGQWSPLPAEIAPFLPPFAAELLWLVALALLCMLAWILIPLLRRDRMARFWSIGMLLALLPACAALPANRLLFFVGIGAMGLLACFVCAVERETKDEGRKTKDESRALRADEGRRTKDESGALRADDGRWTKDESLQSSPVSCLPVSLSPCLLSPVSRLLLVIHLLLAPLMLPITALSPALLGNVEAAISTLPQDATVTERQLVVVTAPSLFSLNVVDSIRGEDHLPAPASTLLLASGLRGAQVERLDQSTIIVRPVGGYLTGFDTVFRATWHPLALGEEVRLSDVTITIAELTPDGRPAAAAFRFHTPLEDAVRQWFIWRAGVYQPFTLPPIGGTVWVEPNQ